MENNHTLTQSSHVFAIGFWKFRTEPPVGLSGLKFFHPQEVLTLIQNNIFFHIFLLKYPKSTPSFFYLSLPWSVTP